MFTIFITSVCRFPKYTATAFCAEMMVIFSNLVFIRKDGIRQVNIRHRNDRYYSYLSVCNQNSPIAKRKLRFYEHSLDLLKLIGKVTLDAGCTFVGTKKKKLFSSNIHLSNEDELSEQAKDRRIERKKAEIMCYEIESSVDVLNIYMYNAIMYINVCVCQYEYEYM